LARIVSIQFSTAGKLYDFDAGSFELPHGTRVIVETERGLGIGTVVREPQELTENLPEKLVPVRRIASQEDLATLERNSQLEKDAYDFCLKRIVERNMQMKLVRVEYQFDGSKAVFFFTADGRVDFRDLVKDLAHTFHTRIEMRQIGVRDESKMIGGIGICGRELCCCSWLRDFQPVSVKMAKEQNLALNPSKISGQCGRLLCCLDYEYETYCCLRKNFPKCGKRVQTPTAAGIVDKINILTGAVTLKQEDNKLVVVRREDISEDTGTEPSQTRVQTPAQQKPAGRQEQRDRQQRPQQHKQRETAAVSAQQQAAPDSPRQAGSPAPVETDAAAGTPPNQGQGRRRNRNRKHGHRKKQNATSPSTPSGNSGA